MPRSRRRTAHPIDDPQQLRVLASGVRQEIIDTVNSLGECSVREIAEALGSHADTLYYHVAQLVEAELLVEVGQRPTGRRPETIYGTATGGLMRLGYHPDDPENADAIGAVVSAMLRTAERDFQTGFDPDRARVSGPERNLNASRQKARLGRAERREVAQLLARLQAIFDDGTESADGELHSFTFVLAPVEERPARRPPIA